MVFGCSAGVRCFYPLSAWQLGDGKIVFVERGDIRRSLQLPCGQCIGCRLARSCEWAIRCVNEAQLYDLDNSFVTLTFDDSKLFRMSLVYRDFQLFMKRLRKRRRAVWNSPRFFACGEYGEEHGRPHFHAILFGCAFPDRVYHKQLPSGSVIYTSAELSSLWPHGFSSIGEVTFDSAAYVARYATKSLLSGHDGKRRDVTQGFVDAETGEFEPMVPEFVRMSLKPGIGAKWFQKYRSDVFGKHGDLDRVVVGGQEMRPPKFYDRMLMRVDGFAAEYVKFLREKEAVGSGDDCTPARLLTREAVTKARLSLKKRGFI